jgi:polysaccharide biosynthesis protein PslG
MTNGWDRMLNARNIMVANGDAAKHVWITEFGGPTNGPATAAILTQAEQAVLLTAGADRASQYPWVAEMCWYSYQDQPGANPATAAVGYWMGLVNSNFSHKLAFSTYQQLTAAAQ